MSARPARSGRWAFALGLVLLGAFALRVWGVRHGLPVPHSSDESGHYVQRALDFFSGDYNPHYFINPPAYSYLLHAVFAVRWLGDGAVTARATDPSAVFLAARLTTVVIGTAAVALVYLAGARLLGRTEGLVAALLLAVGFVGVFWSRLALNDVPAMAAVALALWGLGGALREDRRRDWVIAGVGLGLGVATKYTAGIVAVSIGVALAARFWRDRDLARFARTWAVVGIAAALAFAICDPFALGAPRTFLSALRSQSEASNLSKLGQSDGQGIRYYLESVTWSLGWAAAAAILLGTGVLVRRDRLRAALLGLPVLLFVLFMGRHERYFARWLLPVYPMLCLLAGCGVASLGAWTSARLPRARAAIPVALACLVVAQPLIATLRNDAVLSRASTFSLARAWMDRHVARGAKVVIEPIILPDWSRDRRRRPVWASWTTAHPVDARLGLIDGYARSLTPRLLDDYAGEGYCWIVTSESMYGRVFDDAASVPDAVAYYRELSRRARLAYVASPYRADTGAPRPGRNVVPFEFDQINTYRSFRYERPGWAILIYRLADPRCAAPSTPSGARRPLELTGTLGLRRPIVAAVHRALSATYGVRAGRGP